MREHISVVRSHPVCGILLWWPQQTEELVETPIATGALPKTEESQRREDRSTDWCDVGHLSGEAGAPGSWDRQGLGFFPMSLWKRR